MYRTLSLGTLIFSGLLPVVARGGQLPDQFTLGRYMPGDVWFFIQGAHNDERAWLDAEWAEVFDGLKASGIDKDLLGLLDTHLSDDERATADKWLGLLRSVTWGDLVGREVAFGEHFSTNQPGPEYIVLTRSKAGTLDANLKRIIVILKELAALHEDLNLTTREVDGVSVWSLAFGGPSSEIPFSLQLFRKGDVLGVTTGPQRLEQVVRLMAGKSKKPAVVDTPRFKQALSQLDSPEDLITFFDAKSFAADMKQLMTTSVARAGGTPDAEAMKVLHAIRSAIDLCDVVDYTVATVETQGRKELTHAVARLQSGKRQCSLVSCCVRRKPFQRFDQFIPKEATAFSLSGAVDLGGIYGTILDFIKKDVPGGVELIETWNGILASVGFDPERDLFSWWSGEMISVTLPPAVVTPMGSSDRVLMIRVTNSKLASEKVNQALNAASTKMQAMGQMLMVAPAQMSVDGFQQITHPVMAMFMRPVIGVRGEWLIIGSSPDAIERCLAVADGKAPSIVENQRFQREGLTPKGAVLAASFADTSKFGQQLGSIITGFGMAGGLMSGMIQGDDAAPARDVLQRVMTSLAKLGPVVAKLDFYNSQASVTTFDGETILRTEKVVTYKSPTVGEVKTAGAR